MEICHKEELPQSKHQVLCHKLYENLKEVCNTIHLDGEFMFGFMCKEKRCKNIAYVQMKYPCCPETSLCNNKHNPRMTYDQLIWFIPPKVMDIVNKVSSCMYFVHMYVYVAINH